MKETLKLLLKYVGDYQGRGLNHEGQTFAGALKLVPRFEGKGLSLDFVARGDGGEIFHQEHSLLGMDVSEQLSLWVMSSNHPGVVEHRLVPATSATGASATLAFQAGDLAGQGFREVISIDLWPNGDLSYRYAWGLPGQEFKERSSARMVHGRSRPVGEAGLRETGTGLLPQGPGWYIINTRDTQWKDHPKFGAFCRFEGDVRFDQYGLNIHVLQPGQPNCHYHGEGEQEDFLVLHGECVALIEGEERVMREGDFIHCPPWARHVFVGAGDGPCTLLCVGSRTGHGVIYPVNELTRKYGAGPERLTESPDESYAGTGAWTNVPGRWPL